MREEEKKRRREEEEEREEVMDGARIWEREVKNKEKERSSGGRRIGMLEENREVERKRERKIEVEERRKERKDICLEIEGDT